MKKKYFADTSGLVSVIVPTRNRPKLLSQTLRCILSQTYRNIEVIVSDDGSTGFDINAVSGMQDDRVRIISSEIRTGVSQTRNRGIVASTGIYVAFCDDDDLWLADKLECQMEAMRVSGNHWSYSSSLAVTEDLKPWAESSGPNSWEPGMIYKRNLVPGGGSSVVASRLSLDAAGFFDQRLSQFADWEMWMRLSETGPPAPSDKIGMLYRIHNNQMSNTNFIEIEAELAYLQSIYTSKMGDQPRGLDFGNQLIVHHMRKSGLWWQAIRHTLKTANPRYYHKSLYTLAAITLDRFGFRRSSLKNKHLQSIINDVES